MSEKNAKYRFLLVQAFEIPGKSKYYASRAHLPKEEALRNYKDISHLLEDVDWEIHLGGVPQYGDWAVENREEFAYAASARLPAVREAAESGKYNGIILLGGGEPGFLESREICRKNDVVVTSCGFSQMHIATMLGNKFSVIDFAEPHNMYYYNLVVQHRFDRRCASIRNIGFYHPRPGYDGEPDLTQENIKALNGEHSDAVEKAVEEAESALREDGAEVLTFGCSGMFWLQPFLQKRLAEKGWEVPVLEGYSCSIMLAKMMVDMGINASGITFPGDRPKKRPRRILF